MPTVHELLEEFEVQAPLTRKYLERLPEDQLLWKPHEKSMTAGQLALHLASVPGAVATGSLRDTVPPPTFIAPQPESLKQILATFGRSVETVRSVLPGFDQMAMDAAWSIVDGDRTIATISRGTLFRDVMLNHWYQHRGQFAVYLRMLGQPVPATWGPSGDEQPN
jgi:uncharacterized damage-inducible protein DinB